MTVEPAVHWHRIAAEVGGPVNTRGSSRFARCRRDTDAASPVVTASDRIERGSIAIALVFP